MEEKKINIIRSVYVSSFTYKEFATFNRWYRLSKFLHVNPSSYLTHFSFIGKHPCDVKQRCKYTINKKYYDKNYTNLTSNEGYEITFKTKLKNVFRLDIIPIENLCEQSETDIAYYLTYTSIDKKIGDIDYGKLKEKNIVKVNSRQLGLEYKDISEKHFVMKYVEYILKHSKLINNVFVIPFPRTNDEENLNSHILYHVFPEKKIRSGYFKEGFEEKGIYIF